MELSIDTASDLASVALSREGRLEAAITWQCRRAQSVELLPTIDRLLRQAGAAKQDLTAAFVCLGPGGYTGLRAGVATAQGLAFALGLATAGVSRLELDAAVLYASDRPIVPLHSAGRGEMAWAVYESTDEGLRELRSPALSLPEALVEQAPPDALFCGEVTPEVAELIALQLPSAKIAPPHEKGRAVDLARIGFQRLAAGKGVEPALLRPLYLREPVIGPPR